MNEFFMRVLIGLILFLILILLSLLYEFSFKETKFYKNKLKLRIKIENLEREEEDRKRLNQLKNDLIDILGSDHYDYIMRGEDQPLKEESIIKRIKEIANEKTEKNKK